MRRCDGWKQATSLLAVGFACATVFLSPAGNAKIITFDPLGSVQTEPTSINASGTIAGWYVDDKKGSKKVHGFVRTTHGTITTFNAPKGKCGTSAWSINRHDVITGPYLDGNCNWHGYLRQPDSTFVAFDVGGAIDVEPLSINDNGGITGFYNVCSDGCMQDHGFLRAANGTITEFDPKRSVETVPDSINNAGAITGTYEDDNNVWHGFARAAYGNITTFDPAGSIGTSPTGINRAGTIAGSYNAPPPGGVFGFLRAFDGNIVAVDPDGSDNVQVFALNNKSAVVGYLETDTGSYAGFVQFAGGKVTTFDPKGSVNTNPLAINSRGAIAGWYQTENPGPIHGFMREP